MFSWEWESFEQIIKSHSVDVQNAGPLRSPIINFLIRRNNELDLVMATRGPADARSTVAPPPPGTVLKNTDRVEFASRDGLVLVAEGVFATNTQISGTEEMLQDCTIHQLVGSLQPTDRQIAFVVDWLANVDDIFFWPDMVQDIVQGARNRRFGLDATGPVLQGQTRSEESSWRAAQLSIDGCTLFVCGATPNPPVQVREPGYILYVGSPTDKFREKVRDCLSLALGTFLVYLGCSSFDKDSFLVAFVATAGYSMDGRAFDLPTFPPSPLGSQFGWKIERDALSRSVNGLYNSYDLLNIGVLNWAYWHAVAASPHIAGVHFGAVIESLERAYLKGKADKVNRSLIEKFAWNQLRDELEAILGNAGLKEEVKAILINKLSNLNDAPQSVLTENLLTSLGLRLGERERKALRLRNISAHGKDNEVDVEWIRDLKLMRIRFHRMLLAMTGASDSYYDFFTVGEPVVRRLAEPIPD